MKFFLKLISLVALMCAGAYLAQDFLIFPAIVHAKKFRFTAKQEALPLAAERLSVRTSDDEEIAIWKLSTADRTRHHGVAILFHDGDQTLRSFFSVQKWFQERNFDSYAFDYRGFGESSGWPSESGMQQDSDAVIQRIVEEEGISAKDFVFAGEGIGAAVAASAAKKFSPRFLLLVSPLEDINERFRNHPVLRFFIPLLRYHFSAADALTRLDSGCVEVIYRDVSANGAVSGQKVIDAYRGQGRREKLVSTISNRSAELLQHFGMQLDAAMQACGANHTD
jgi:pimeloyl-ACP methyl ester carboxylesterase